MTGGGPFALPPGAWTDDTAMALALADSLAATDTLDGRDLMDRFVQWWQHGEYSCTGTCFSIGNATRAALDRYVRTGDPFAGSTHPHTAGNGSLMRLAPVALRFWNDRSRLADTRRRPVPDDPRRRGSGGRLPGVRGTARGRHRRDRRAPLSWRRDRSREAPAVADIMAGSWRGRARNEIRSSGYVVHTLEAALWSVARTGDFRNAVLLAANLADDADTVAAVTGQLAGALYGLSGIPDRWLDRLAWKDRLMEAAQRLLPAPPADREASNE